jgi:hypothetical protein
MIETLVGTLFGGIFRMAPEILKWMDRKDERAHELSMFDKQLEADKLKGDQAVAQINAQADATIGAAEVQAIIEATKAQATPSGIKWVDAINSLMRPTITFWWVIVLYSTALVAQYVALLGNSTDYLQAILKLWGPDEKAIVASIISFWFVDRSLRKGFGK